MADTADSQLATTRERIDVATASIGSTRIAYAAQLNEGETIADATATLLRTTAVSGGSAVAGFVTGTAVEDTDVIVAWTGAVLVPGESYTLLTVAELDTGDTIPAATTFRCVV